MSIYKNELYKGCPLNRKQQYAMQEQVQYAEISTVKVYTNVNNISTPEKFGITELFGLFVV